MTEIRAIAFDYDGVLADSVGAHTKARLQAFAKLGYGGINPNIHARAHRHGSHPPEIIGWVLKTAGIIPDTANSFDHPIVQEVVNLKSQIFFEESARGLNAIPGAIEYVKKVVETYGSACLAISTTASRLLEVNPFLLRHNLLDIFGIIVGKEETPGGQEKPHPYVYTETSKRLRIAPKNIAAIEDTPRGVESAHGAGMYVVGITTTHSLNDLEGADRVVQNFADIDALLTY